MSDADASYLKDASVCLAVDIGGTKLAAGLVDEKAVIVARDQCATPRGTDAGHLFSVLAGLIDGLIGRAARLGVSVQVCGVGTGGPMEPGGTAVSPLNIPAWRDFPLRSRLEQLPGIAATPVLIDNDAKALTLAEAWAGAGRGVPNFLAMVVSTGVGGGIVLEGRLLEGRTGNVGHIGHVVVVPSGRPCLCGSRGCLEAETSGRAIEEMTGRPAEEAGPEVVERAGVLVGRAVASVANLLDLQLALVGGSVVLGYGADFFVAVQRELDATARIAHARGCKVQPVALGASGPMVGAAAVGWRGLGRLVEVA